MNAFKISIKIKFSLFCVSGSFSRCGESGVAQQGMCVCCCGDSIKIDLNLC